MRASAILAATFGWNQRDLASYRYQATRTKRAICVSPAKPRDEFKWSAYNDQFWAKQHNTTVWVANCDDSN